MILFCMGSTLTMALIWVAAWKKCQIFLDKERTLEALWNLIHFLAFFGLVSSQPSREFPFECSIFPLYLLYFKYYSTFFRHSWFHIWRISSLFFSSPLTAYLFVFIILFSYNCLYILCCFIYFTCVIFWKLIRHLLSEFLLAHFLNVVVLFHQPILMTRTNWAIHNSNFVIIACHM